MHIGHSTLHLISWNPLDNVLILRVERSSTKKIFFVELTFNIVPPVSYVPSRSLVCYAFPGLGTILIRPTVRTPYQTDGAAYLFLDGNPSAPIMCVQFRTKSTKQPYESGIAWAREVIQYGGNSNYVVQSLNQSDWLIDPPEPKNVYLLFVEPQFNRAHFYYEYTHESYLRNGYVELTFAPITQKAE